MKLTHPISHGNRVRIVNRFGQQRTGTVNGLLITRGSHCVLNMGGRHGTPAVASDENIVAINGRPVSAPRSAERAAEASYLEGMEG